MSDDIKHAVIVAGGTGGHIYPALAFAANWQAQGHRVTWIGTQEGLEASIVPKHNLPLYFIQVKGVRRSGKIAQFFSLLGAVHALFQAIKLLQQLKPHVVLGMGGYVSGPSVLAARLLKIPVVIHEQNAIAGKTNQLAARFAQKVLTAFPGVLTQCRPIVCGNPVRADLITLQPKRYINTPMRVLIVGGSRGAQNLNKILPGLLMKIDNIEIWHQTGEKHFEEAKIIYSQIEEGRPPAVPTPKIMPYIDDMKKAYEWADVVICRAGAMTVFEIMAVGRPAIFIPYPYAVDDHQTANANYLVDKAAAMLIQEKDLTLENLKPLVDALKEDLNYQRYARNVYANRVIDADCMVVRLCLEVAR